MKNSSYVKIIAVLTAFSLYVFLFGFVHPIGGDGDTDDVSTDENGSVVEVVPAEPKVGELDGTDIDNDVSIENQGGRIDVANYRPPSYIDYNNPLPINIGGDFLTDSPDTTTTATTEPAAADTTVDEHGDGAEVIDLPENATTSEPRTATTAAATSAVSETPPPLTTTATPTTVTTTTTATTASTTEAVTTSPKAEDIADVNTKNPAVETEPVGIGEMFIKTGGKEVRGDALDIISRIVECEVGSSFDTEAIKAQAVASYTYVKYANERGIAADVFAGKAASEKVKTAVSSVLGQGVYYNGKLIQAVYSASSPGYTANSANVWSGELPYLLSRECDFDKEYDPNYGLKVEFTAADVKKRISNVTGIEVSGDPADWIEIISHTDHVYVGNMKIGGAGSYVSKVTGNTIPLNGKTFRENVMGYDLKSAAFSFVYDADSDKFLFTTYGYGHGVGMQQNGANILAKYYGYDYKDILEFYYNGVTVK